MDRKTTQPRTPTLKEVLEGAEQASRRFADWPQWKRELSSSPSRRQGNDRAPKTDKFAG